LSARQYISDLIDVLQTNNSRRDRSSFQPDPAIALNIKDTETEKLAAEVAEMTGDTKTGAVREALREKKRRLEMRSESKEQRRQSLREYLETEIWPQIPDELLDREPMSKEEVEDILGFGPEGY
jgi:antitoxin VapB